MRTLVKPHLERSRYASGVPRDQHRRHYGESPEQATPGDVSAFLCEVADEKGTGYAHSTFDGLLYVFRRIRPNDNPADFASVRKTLRGLKRERPSPPRQATPIGTEDLAILIKTAHNERPRELEDKNRLRAAVDIALLCTMHDSAIRAEEAAKAKWDDLHNAPDGRGGSVLTIRSSKTDQLHEGAVLYLTKVATDAINHMKDVRAGARDSGHRRRQNIPLKCTIYLPPYQGSLQIRKIAGQVHSALAQSRQRPRPADRKLLRCTDNARPPLEQPSIVNSLHQSDQSGEERSRPTGTTPQTGWAHSKTQAQQLRDKVPHNKARLGQ